jgi:hypothetical protein
MKLIAFAGYAGAGKDEAAIPLIQRGYTRCCFGDIIKRQLDPVIQHHFGFSAFTADREQKGRVRRTLESWGEDNYEAIFKEFFSQLPDKAVNTRIIRAREATEWRNLGGIIVEINRPDLRQETAWSHDMLEELRTGGFIDATIVNGGSVADLHQAVNTLADLDRSKIIPFPKS